MGNVFTVHYLIRKKSDLVNEITYQKIFFFHIRPMVEVPVFCVRSRQSQFTKQTGEDQ